MALTRPCGPGPPPRAPPALALPRAPAPPPLSPCPRATLPAPLSPQERRAASISGRLQAPSTLLVVTRDLPARMSRANWNLRDYNVIEKMYTGARGAGVCGSGGGEGRGGGEGQALSRSPAQLAAQRQPLCRLACVHPALHPRRGTRARA